MSSILFGLVFPSATFYKSNQLKDKRQHYCSDLGEFHIYLAILEVISVTDFSFSQALAFWLQSQKGHLRKESFQVKVFWWTHMQPLHPEMPLEIPDTMLRGWAHIDYWVGKLFWTQSLCASILWVIKPNVLSFRKQLSPISRMQCPLPVNDGEEATGFTVLMDHFWEPHSRPSVLSWKGNWAKHGDGAGGCPWGYTLHSL